MTDDLTLAAAIDAEVARRRAVQWESNMSPTWVDGYLTGMGDAASFIRQLTREADK